MSFSFPKLWFSRQTSFSFSHALCYSYSAVMLTGSLVSVLPFWLHCRGTFGLQPMMLTHGNWEWNELIGSWTTQSKLTMLTKLTMTHKQWTNRICCLFGLWVQETGTNILHGDCFTSGKGEPVCEMFRLWSVDDASVNHFTTSAKWLHQVTLMRAIQSRVKGQSSSHCRFIGNWALRWVCSMFCMFYCCWYGDVAHFYWGLLRKRRCDQED